MMTELTPPPRTTILPETFTLSRISSPSPTPSPMIRSPDTVSPFRVTPGTLTMTFPPDTEV